MGKKKHFPNDHQPSLFDRIKETARAAAPAAGSMDVEARFRAAVSEAIRTCELSRAQIAARMTDLTGDEITRSKLNSWTAESKEQHRFPAIFMPAFLEATGSDEPLKVLGQPARLYVMKSPDALGAEQARIQEQINKLKARNREIATLKRIVGGK